MQVGYGSVRVIHGVDFVVEAGEFAALLGPNGAGKTTMLKALTGLVPPMGGKITFKNRDITQARPEQIVRLGLTLVPEGRWIFPRLTVMENLKMGAYLKPTGFGEQLEWVLGLFPRLKNRMHIPGGALSGGEQQMLAIARALMSQPSLILLDEPSLGVAPVLRDTIYERLKILNEQHHMTILVVEQYPEWVSQYARRWMLLNHGQVLADRRGAMPSPEELVDAYLS